MKNKLSLLLLVFVVCIPGLAQGYQSLDKKTPISFDGQSVSYQGRTYKLGPRTFFLDGQFTQAEADKYPYVFRTFQEVNAMLQDGTTTEPMTVLIAPWVYWLNDPDTPEEVRTQDGSAPIGMHVKCENLHLTGLNPDPANVVFAARRGQTQGSRGNFTMVDFTGDGLTIRDMTLGNFCNVDLQFPLNPKLNRAKRNSAYAQAHVAYCHGDCIYAENVRFISRLNMNPLSGAKRILFNRCHMECTDDALASTGVYLNCNMVFYSTKPFWNSDRHGAIFLNSDFHVMHNSGRQNFTKSLNPLSIIDCRYHVTNDTYAAWTLVPEKWLRCNQANVTMNGQPIVIAANEPDNTVLLDDKPALKAFKFADGTYNIYNLLRGEDDWDPLGQKETIGDQDANLATTLYVTPLRNKLQTGEPPITLHADAMRHVGYNLNAFYQGKIKWKVEAGFEKYVRIQPKGNDCTVTSINEEETPKHFAVMAYTEDGLEGAAAVTAQPAILPAPTFVRRPKLIVQDGVARVDYQLDLNGRVDESLISWYRIEGNKEYPISVSRNNMPERSYQLQPADNNCLLKVVVEPKHLRSLPGARVTLISKTIKLKRAAKKEQQLTTDFHNLPCANQLDLKPGLWTIDGHKPSDVTQQDWTVDQTVDFWTYGAGINGCKGTGLMQTRPGSRLRYTPIGCNYGDMDVTLIVDPCKQAGQGFSSARQQYMDICLKFDTQTLTGYALRIIRTTKYSNAVDFLLVRYDHGQITPITSPISSNCYLTNCTLRLFLKGNKFHASASTTTPLQKPADEQVKPTVELEAEVAPNAFGGFAIQHTGTAGEGVTMLRHLEIQWK
jgi:hypothetical protein